MAGTLTVDRDGALAILTLANPTKKNALDPPVLDALVDALGTLGASDARAVVLTAEGDVFSSGYDLGALEDGRGPAPLERAVRAIVDGALPVVAALPGLAIGGGCELACACDLRVAHPGVVLQMPPVRLGLVYPAAGLRRFVALIGSSRTRELFLTGERVPAERALAWGLIDRVVPAEAVRATALDLARSISRGAPAAIAGTRRLLAALEAPLPPALEEELEQVVRAAFASDEAKEARAAFRERRAPSFSPKR